jgi:hypothetical protein
VQDAGLDAVALEKRPARAARIGLVGVDGLLVEADERVGDARLVDVRGRERRRPDQERALVDRTCAL